jgi:hypothetical protein
LNLQGRHLVFNSLTFLVFFALALSIYSIPFGWRRRRSSARCELPVLFGVEPASCSGFRPSSTEWRRKNWSTRDHERQVQGDHLITEALLEQMQLIAPVRRSGDAVAPL